MSSDLEASQPAGARRHRPCPRCGSHDVHRSRTRNVVERAAKWFGLGMRRCHGCDFRFARLGNLVLPEGAVRILGTLVPLLLLLAVWGLYVLARSLLVVAR